MPLTLTPKEAAHELRLSRRKVFDLLGSGDLVSFKIGRSRRISRQSLEQFIEHQAMAPRGNGADR